jgi:Bifunctional DNA primase/polymerase, N-terminal
MVAASPSSNRSPARSRPLTAWSGRNDGGRHLYFLRPPGPLTSTRLPEGIDLKMRGYMIMPPSIHPATGQPYRWEHQPAAPLPPKLRLLLCPAPKPVQTFTSTAKNGSGLIRKVAEATEGQRHDVLVWASFRARDDGILDQIADQLIAAAVSTGETETSARRTVVSVRRSS